MDFWGMFRIQSMSVNACLCQRFCFGAVWILWKPCMPILILKQQRKNRKKTKRLQRPPLLLWERDHGNHRSCLARVAVEISSNMFASVAWFCSAAFFTWYIRFTYFIPPHCDVQSSFQETHVPPCQVILASCVLVTGTEEFSCRGWSTRSCRGIPRSCNVLLHLPRWCVLFSLPLGREMV